MRLQDEQNCCSHCQARFEHRANKGSNNTGERELNSVIAWQSFHCGIRHCHCTAQENCGLQRNMMPNTECSEERVEIELLAWSTAAIPTTGLKKTKTYSSPHSLYRFPIQNVTFLPWDWAHRRKMQTKPVSKERLMVCPGAPLYVHVKGGCFATWAKG